MIPNKPSQTSLISNPCSKICEASLRSILLKDTKSR